MSAPVYTLRTHSPLGPITLTAQGNALTGLWFNTPPVNATAQASWVTDERHPVLAQASKQLEEYFCGQRNHFDLKLAPQGSAFQRAVWAALLKVGFGQTLSYSQLAQAIGKPKAARAVGAAVGANPLSIIIPCHRIIGANGSLTGYAGGLQRKVALLGLESHKNLNQKKAPIDPRPRVHNLHNACAQAHSGSAADR